MSSINSQTLPGTVSFLAGGRRISRTVFLLDDAPDRSSDERFAGGIRGMEHIGCTGVWNAGLAREVINETD
jgi:hypothetical protein